MTDRKKPGVAFWATVVVVVVLVLCGYAGAYLCMVIPTETNASGIGPWKRWPDYTGQDGERDQDFWENVFAPAHWVDWRIRRDVWFFE